MSWLKEIYSLLYPLLHVRESKQREIFVKEMERYWDRTKQSLITHKNVEELIWYKITEYERKN